MQIKNKLLLYITAIILTVLCSNSLYAKTYLTAKRTKKLSEKCEIVFKKFKNNKAICSCVTKNIKKFVTKKSEYQFLYSYYKRNDGKTCNGPGMLCTIDFSISESCIHSTDYDIENPKPTDLQGHHD